MNKKIISYLMIFSSLSLFSLGFSSWVIISPDYTIPDNLAIVDGVIADNPYISFDTSKGTNNTGIDYLEYLKSGFRLDGAQSNYGEINIYLIIDLDNCRSNFGKAASIEISANLFYYSQDISNFNIFFYRGSDFSIASDYSINGSNIDSFFTKGEDLQDIDVYEEYSIRPMTCLFNNILEKETGSTYTFSIKYTFTVSSIKSSFEAEVYPYLLNSSFSIELGLKGVSE